MPHPCCKQLEYQSVPYDPKEENRGFKVQEQAIALLVSLIIPAMNRRESRANTPPKGSVNGGYTVGSIKIQLTSFNLFQLHKMQQIGVASAQREWLLPACLSKC